MTIAQLIGPAPRPPVTVTPQMRVAEVVALLHSARIGAVPVVDDGGEPIGIFSERDLVRILAERSGDGEEACGAVLAGPVGDVMTSPALTVTPETPVLSALSLMTRRRIRHLPVMTAGALVAVVSIGDLVKYRIDRIEAEATLMRDYITLA